MTSRQPDTTPPGTAGHAVIPGSARHRPVSAERWPVLVLPLVLLIMVGLAGLRVETTGLGWDGPLHSDAVAVGLALEIVLGIMLVIAIRRLTVRRHAGTVTAAPASLVAVKLRRLLVVVLSAGMLAVAVTTLVGLHQHVFSGRARAQPGQVGSAGPASPARRAGWHFPFPLHVHATANLLYGLLVLVFLSAVVLRVWWVRRFGSSGAIRAYHYLTPGAQDLLEVVESGRWALRAVDDARAAIIACYVAMEASLAEHGAARAIADTPDELLTRATAMGIVRSTAAARLTALFYEARFSSHPLDRGQREAAGQALAELAAALAEAEAAAGTRAGRPRANRTQARA